MSPKAPSGANGRLWSERELRQVLVAVRDRCEWNGGIVVLHEHVPHADPLSLSENPRKVDRSRPDVDHPVLWGARRILRVKHREAVGEARQNSRIPRRALPVDVHLELTSAGLLGDQEILSAPDRRGPELEVVVKAIQPAPSLEGAGVEQALRALQSRPSRVRVAKPGTVRYCGRPPSRLEVFFPSPRDRRSECADEAMPLRAGARGSLASARGPRTRVAVADLARASVSAVMAAEYRTCKREPDPVPLARSRRAGTDAAAAEPPSRIRGPQRRASRERSGVCGVTVAGRRYGHMDCVGEATTRYVSRSSRSDVEDYHLHVTGPCRRWLFSPLRASSLASYRSNPRQSTPPASPEGGSAFDATRS